MIFQTLEEMVKKNIILLFIHSNVYQDVKNKFKVYLVENSVKCVKKVRLEIEKGIKMRQRLRKKVQKNVAFP